MAGCPDLSFFSRKFRLRVKYIVVDNCGCTVYVYLNLNCFQIISLTTSQAIIDSLQPMAEIMGEDIDRTSQSFDRLSRVDCPPPCMSKIHWVTERCSGGLV